MELEKLNNAIEEVKNSNLSNETKEFVLNELRKRLFELRNEISSINKNVETYKTR